MATKKVIILRGLPGSGKTRWVMEFLRERRRVDYIEEKLLREHGLMDDAVVCSADDYFMVDGTYQFDPGKLPLAHAACMKKFLQALNDRRELIIVDNTNSQKWEFDNYDLAAALAGYHVEVQAVHAPPRSLTVEQLRAFAARNVHGVPESVIAAVAMRWEE